MILVIGVIVLDAYLLLFTINIVDIQSISRHKIIEALTTLFFYLIGYI